MEAERLQSRERLRLEVRRELHLALGELVPARKVIVFGSLVKRGGLVPGIALAVGKPGSFPVVPA